MLRIKLNSSEEWNPVTEEFEYSEPVTIELEHSLLSMSKWEEITHKPFFGDSPKSTDEHILYMKCMIMNDADPDSILRLSKEDINKISNYLEDPHTATWFSKSDNKGKSKEVLTSELIYYYMTVIGIPFECERWNLKRLLTLIQIANEKNKKQEPEDPRKTAQKYRELNRQRLAKTGGKG